MKVFISINDLGCGGAQKSLISLLNILNTSYGMEIDLLVLDNTNIFFDDVPEWVHVLEAKHEVKAMFMPMKALLKSKLPYRTKLKGLFAKLLMKTTRKSWANNVQRVWKAWKNFVPTQKKIYDLAISYVDGFSNYYVMDKVLAKRKILWVHNEYEKLNYRADFDRPYFEKADNIVTISELCIRSLKNVFPDIEKKFVMLPNLSASESIRRMADMEIPSEYIGRKNILVSIGRLNEQKGFDMAIKAARILKNSGENFCWFVIGQGELEEPLKTMVLENGLEEEFRLIGVRKNPYPYIKNSLIFVQPSRYEGKSIVLDEAKILEKPIVVTNYTTVRDSIVNGLNGTVVGFDEKELANAIRILINSDSLRTAYIEALKKENEASNYEINGYLDLMLGKVREKC